MYMYHFKFKLFDLYLRDELDLWGFELITIEFNYLTYSMFALLFKIHNKPGSIKFTICDWDFLFIERLLCNLRERLKR